MSPSIVWFRKDLRVTDHPALLAALKKGSAVIPLYIHCSEEEGEWAPGSASKKLLPSLLKKLEEDLSFCGLKLLIKSGSSHAILSQLIEETGAKTLYWNRCYEPALIARDTKLKSTLKIEVKSFNGSLLYEPFEVATREGNPYKVFTPFYKACLNLRSPRLPLPAPSPKIVPLDLIQFDLSLYDSQRDRPGIEGTSKLSTALHFGVVSPWQVWHQASSSLGFCRQLIWREFAHHLLFHFPQTPNEPLYPKYAAFPWQKNSSHLNAWQQGMTGYPFVDAGMRQLYQTGWMHNRLRMVVGSFLVKDLLISWVEGAKWFWEMLEDADLANNTLGWQWVGGCGADAAPYYRIFNPVTQGERFDPEGAYIKKFVPELKKLPPKWIHRPWEAPVDVLLQANVVLGHNYPRPIVDHKEARERALKALKEIS